MARYGVVILSIVVIAALAILAGACGTQGSGEEQSSFDATRQAGQRAQSRTEETTKGDARFSAQNLQELDNTIAKVRKDKNLPGLTSRKAFVLFAAARVPESVSAR